MRHIAEELLQTIEGSFEWEGDQPVVANRVCPLPLGTSVNAGRNDPCLCGSGRKLKHFAGQVHPVPDQEETPSDPNAPPCLVLDCLLLVPIGSRPIRQGA